MSASFLSLFDDLTAAVHNEDFSAFHQLFGQIWDQAQTLGPDDLTAGIELLAPVLIGSGGPFAKTGVLAGALVERGGSPLPLRDALPRRAAAAMRLRARFPEAWTRATDGQPLPNPDGGYAVMGETLRLLTKKVKRTGLSKDECFAIALSWHDTEDWLKPMITVLARREFRKAMGYRNRVRDAAAAIVDDSQRAHWVRDLTLVLDDEPLIALDPASGRGFRMTMSGVGDNFQLHTLLADRLIGPGRLDGERVKAAWVEAATTGSPGPLPDDPIYRRFRLFDGHGAHVFPEGRPADIKPLDGTRVVVLHPPLGNYGWLQGRVYEHMEPYFTLDQELTPAEAADWLARVAPARETDVMGMNR